MATLEDIRDIKQQVKCEACSEEFDLATYILKQPKSNGVWEVGIVCPNCDAYTHSYFETEKIILSRGKMNAAMQRFQKCAPAMRSTRWQQYQFQKSVYSRIFREEQAIYRKRYRIPAREAPKPVQP